MKDVILLELAKRWEKEAEEAVNSDGSLEANRRANITRGRRECKRECADTLRLLVSALGDPE